MDSEGVKKFKDTATKILESIAFLLKVLKMGDPDNKIQGLRFSVAYKGNTGGHQISHGEWEIVLYEEEDKNMNELSNE